MGGGVSLRGPCFTRGQGIGDLFPGIFNNFEFDVLILTTYQKTQSWAHSLQLTLIVCITVDLLEASGSETPSRPSQPSTIIIIMIIVMMIIR